MILNFELSLAFSYPTIILFGHSQASLFALKPVHQCAIHPQFMPEQTENTEKGEEREGNVREERNYMGGETRVGTGTQGEARGGKTRGEKARKGEARGGQY